MSGASSNPKRLQPASLPTQWNWFEALCIGALAIIGVDILLGILLSVLVETLKTAGFSGLAQGLSTNSIGLNFAFYTLSRLLGFGLIWWFLKRRGMSLSQFGFRKFSIKKAIWLIVVAGLAVLGAAIAVFVVVSIFFPAVNLDQAQELVFTQATTPLELILSFIALIIIAPVVEESVFRGLLLPGFARNFGLAAAVVISAVLFGAIHWQLNVGIITAIMGVLLGWIYLKSQSLWPAIMFHSLKNLVAFILIFSSLLK